jgi:ABC-type lipoprotein export system ATPase subunit
LKSKLNENNAAVYSEMLDDLEIKIDAVDLSYSVYFNGKRHALLKNINFHLNRGDMCALMGPSGAGKRFWDCYCVFWM